MLITLQNWLFDMYMEVPGGSLREKFLLKLMMFLVRFQREV